MREKLNSTPKATSDQLAQLEGVFVNEHLSNSPFLSVINDSVLKVPYSEESFQTFQSLSNEAKIVTTLVFEMKYLEGHGHSDYRPDNHQQTLEEASNFLQRLK